MKLKPSISIVIRTKNEERFIREVLQGIFEQKIDLSFEVVVIDSGSTDRTLDIIRQFKVRLYEIPPDQFTFGYALNYGIELSKGEYIVNLSAHCIPVDSMWMVNLLTPILSDSSIAATYGRQKPLKGLNPFEEQAIIADFSPDKEGKIKPVFSNSNCAIRKVVWEKYPFDEKAFFAEDFIWAKMLPPEYKIKYVHAASVYHSHPLTLKYWAKRYYDNGVFEYYLEQAYDLQWHWKSSSNIGKHSISKRVFRWTKTNLAGFLHTITFLIGHKYYRFIPILPIFVILRLYYYQKGIKDGKMLCFAPKVIPDEQKRS